MGRSISFEESILKKKTGAQFITGSRPTATAISKNCPGVGKNGVEM